MIMTKSLRLSLIAIENSLKEMINDGAASDYSCDEFNLKLAEGIIDHVRLVEVGRKKTFPILIDS